VLTAGTRLRIAGLCGIVAPFFLLLLLLFTILISPWFSWTDNALSDLGVQGNSAIIFNLSLIFGGILIVVFAGGFFKTLKSHLSRIGASIIFLDGISLIAIGVFPETFGVLHTFVSVIFFTLLPLYLWIFGVALIRETPETRFGVLIILLGIGSASIWMLGWDGVAIPETFASLAGSVWLVTMGLRMFRQKHHGLYPKKMNQFR